jgi:hypothetical protein
MLKETIFMGGGVLIRQQNQAKNEGKQIRRPAMLADARPCGQRVASRRPGC